MSKKNTGKTQNKARKPRKKKSGKKKQIQINFTIIAVIITMVAILVALPHIKDDSPKQKGANVPSGAYSFGIDISHYQSEIKWDSLMVMTDGAGRTILSKTQAKDIKPIDFVFIKATEGTEMIDKRFAEHWQEAGKRDIRRGAYHFFRSSKNGKAQAKNFIKAVGNLRYKDLPPVLDIETIHRGCSDATFNSRALEWLETIEKYYDRKPIVYSSSYFIEKHLSKKITDNYPIWVAHYNVSEPRHANWKFWQFTDEAVVYGIEGEVDLNVCRTEELH